MRGARFTDLTGRRLRAQMGAMTGGAQFSSLPRFEELATRWRALEARTSDMSFFLGWTWMGAWLGSSGAAPTLLSVQDAEGQDVAMALIGTAQQRRRFGGLATAWLNQAGTMEMDRPFIEYNGLLVADDAPAGTWQMMVDALFTQNDWKALYLSGVEPESPLVTAGKVRRRILRDRSPAYFVDLHAIRQADGEYLFLLSSNTRSQIRRSIKEHGEPEAQAAQLPSQVDDWLGDMERLNRGRHQDNAWDHPGFRRFIRAVALAGLATGEVEVLRITTGDALAGYLVNFLYRGRAMNYQSAFVEAASNKSKPGLMCHMAAAERYACRADLEIYSLLAGKDRYKQSLSTGSETLEWWVLERACLPLEAEALARRLLRRPVGVVD